MKRKLIALISAILVSIPLIYLTASSRENTEDKIVTRVIDGDTIVVEGGQRVRLLGIDTQEEGERCYERAKNRLEEMILKKEIEMEGEGTGQYDRKLAYIFLNDTFINAEMVREGLAVAYFYEEDAKYKDRIQRAEEEARKRGIGCEWN